MKSFQWLAITAGIAALAACGGSDEANETNVEVNAADTMLPPADLNADMNAGMNADMNVGMNATDNMANMANNTADNTTNAY
jgi:predicted small lipoprotein YifL